MTLISRLLLAALLLIAVLAAACDDDDNGSSSSPTPAADITWSQLRNLAYPSVVSPGETYTLVNGIDSEAGDDTPAARLVDVGAFGDLDGDDATDAAVFLAEQGDEGEQITSVLAVLNDGGEPVVSGQGELGTDVAIRAVTIEDGEIIVREVLADSVDEEEDQVEERLRRFALGEEGFAMVSETTATVPLTQPEEFEFESIPLETAPSGSTIERRLGSRGVAPFVINGVEGQEFAVSVASEHDSAVLSIQGLSDLSQPVVFRDFETSFTGELAATQEYAVRVVSVLGSDLDVEVNYTLGEPPEPTPSPVPTPPPGPAPAPTSASELAAAVPVLFSGVPSTADAPLADLSPEAAAFLPDRVPPRGIAVILPEQGVTYVDNADQEMETASVIKVAVMACVMARAEAQGRLVSEWELSLMWPMITQSNNDATDALWSDLGGGPGVAACLSRLGVSGITPYNGPYWGTSTASARGMAMLLARIAYADLVNAQHRAASLAMLVSVVPGQRWGVPAGADASGEEIVGVKDGWYPDDDGWRVNSAGFISPLVPGAIPYAIAGMTNGQATQEYGIATIEGASEPVWRDIRGR